MTDLPAHPVSVVVAGRHVADRVAAAVLQENTAPFVPIQMTVVRSVSVQREVLDHHVGGSLAGQQREQRLDGRLSGQPEVFSEPTVQFEPVA